MGRARLPYFVNFRLRLLLQCGVTWQTHQTTTARPRTTFRGAEPLYQTTLAFRPPPDYGPGGWGSNPSRPANAQVRG
jgi:hypothetical protein